MVEASYYNNGILKRQISSTVSYQFIEDKDPILHRTKHLNTILKQINTDIIGLWEADIILEYSPIIEAVHQFRTGNCDFAFPYDGRCFDTSEILRNHYLLHRNIDFLKKNISKMDLIYSSSSKGNAVGSVLFHLTHPRDQNGKIRSDYYEAKIMNEYYKTWNSTKEELTNKLHE